MNSTLGVSAIDKPCTKCGHLVSSVASLDIRIVRPSFVFPFHFKVHMYSDWPSAGDFCACHICL